jgi:NDP-sugar pyrophosphorylase family protein
MQVIVPMSGIGKRFADAGYTDIKPLITVHGKPIIEYVIDLFDKKDDFIFIVNENHLLHTNIKNVLLNYVPNAIIVAIPQHKSGPVYAVQQAYEFIKNDEPCIVNYCDFFMEWDYQHFLQTVMDTACDGAIPCYTGFHPHLLHAQNVYAGCKVDEHHRLISIKEKFSFTSNKMESHHSVGTYYFKNGALLKKYFDALVAAQHQLNGEYYVSMVYEKMIEDGLNIHVYDQIPHFCQWGTPEDLQEYEWWSKVITAEKNTLPIQSTTEATVLMPMAGNGQRFADEGYTTLKPFIKVDEDVMFKKVLTYLPVAKQYVFITKQEIEKDNMPSNSTQILIEKTTEGQACTALLAKDTIAHQEPLWIVPSDNGMLYNVEQLHELTEKVDVIIFTFRNAKAVVAKPEAYGWVVENNFMAERISCKKPISNQPLHDHAITGAFWFKKAHYFYDAAQKMIDEDRRINNEFYIDECMNDCIQAGLKVSVFELDYYIGWGTPNDLRTYQYWKNYFDKKN